MNHLAGRLHLPDAFPLTPECIAASVPVDQSGFMSCIRIHMSSASSKKLDSDNHRTLCFRYESLNLGLWDFI